MWDQGWFLFLRWDSNSDNDAVERKNEGQRSDNGSSKSLDSEEGMTWIAQVRG